MAPDICDRCHTPVTQRDDGQWVHAEYADAAFCAYVMQGVTPVPGD